MVEIPNKIFASVLAGMVCRGDELDKRRLQTLKPYINKEVEAILTRMKEDLHSLLGFHE